MTNEQAIKKAKEQYNEIWDCDINHPKYEDTVEEIITGVIRLIMQPTSDDCVSRQAVKEGMIKYGFHAPDMTVTEFIEDELPSVTPAQSWIPIKRRDLTQEEKESYSSFYGLEPEYMIESRMPDDGEEVLVSVGSIVFKDIFSHHDFDFENISVDEIEAWMPLPKPYEDKRGSGNE